MPFNISPGKTRKEMGIILNGTEVIDPSSCEPSLQDVSSKDAGRDEEGTMHVMKLTSNGKVKLYPTIKLGWKMIDPVNAGQILRLVSTVPDFICTLPDPLTGGMMTGRFYVGDRTMPMQQWMTSRVDGKLYSNLSFTLISVGGVTV